MSTEDRIAALEAEITRMKKTLEATVLDVSAREGDPQEPAEQPPTTSQMEEDRAKQEEMILQAAKDADAALKQNRIEAAQRAQVEAERMAENQTAAGQAVEALHAGEPLLDEPPPPTGPVDLPPEIEHHTP